MKSLLRINQNNAAVRDTARNVLIDIFVGVGPEVFLLCSLNVPISKLSTTKQKDVLPTLRSWWKTASRLKGLRAIATVLCESSSISTLISTSRKRKFSEITLVS
ncbi:MAG: hypothetical protein MMC33_006461, partial [Icmadophila ericetorum]|nr:hypothetical protein [Icmadophila ericetorum]